MSNFCNKVFDFSFKEFVTPSIVKIIFWIVIILIALFTLISIVTGFMNGLGSGLLALIVSPLVGALFVILARVYLEIIMVLFRMVGLLEGIAQAKGVDTGSAASPPPPPVS